MLCQSSFKKLNLSTNNKYTVHKEKIACKNLYRNVNGENKLCGIQFIFHVNLNLCKHCANELDELHFFLYIVKPK